MFSRRSANRKTHPPQDATATQQPSSLPAGAVAVPITPAQAKLFIGRFSAIGQIEAQIQAAAAMVCEGRVLGLGGTPEAPELIVMPSQDSLAPRGDVTTA